MKPVDTCKIAGIADVKATAAEAEARTARVAGWLAASMAKGHAALPLSEAC